MNQTAATEDQNLEALAKVPLFSHLDDRSLRKLARLCKPRSFETGDVLYEEGALGLSLFIVTSGQVEIHRGSGDRRVGLERVTAGGVLGQLALLDEKPRAAGATTLEPTECLQLTRDSFDTLVKKDPQIALCLTPGLAGRVRDLQGLAMEAKLAQQGLPGATAESAKTSAETRNAEPEKVDEVEPDGADDGDEDDDESSELASALFQVMRMQYGLMVGSARAMGEMARTVETFLDSMAAEADFKTSDDWSDFFGKLPEAMVSATRSAMDEFEKVPEEMVDAYQKYGDTEK